jgi:putative glutamine amidotransferase
MQPWVWVTHDHRHLGEGDVKSPFTVLGDKYAWAVKQGAQAEPLTFPAANPTNIDQFLSNIDGVLLTGSPSNVHPSHFQQEVLRPELPLDPQRDALTLPLIQACIAKAIPLLGICRGFQEINVALGGSLHQQVHEVPGMMDHREPHGVSYAEQYAPTHPVRILPHTPLAQWAGAESAMVNSLHGQGIDRLADDLEPMAYAPDGLVEAVHIRHAKAYAFAVQWHPEWRCQEHPLYLRIFQSFGEACRNRQAQRQGLSQQLTTATV